MVKPLVRMLKLNGLQFNSNRDPQAYRRKVGEVFSLQALLEGSGRAQCSVSDAGGATLAADDIARPGVFDAQLRFDTAGSRLVTLCVISGGEHFEKLLRLDVLPMDAHAH